MSTQFPMGRTSTTNILKPAIYMRLSVRVHAYMGTHVCAGGKGVCLCVSLTQMWQRDANCPFDHSVMPLPQTVCVCVRTLPMWLDRNSFFVLWWLTVLSQTERFTASNTYTHKMQPCSKFQSFCFQKCTRSLSRNLSRKKERKKNTMLQINLTYFDFF